MLARKVSRWCKECDRRLHRLVSYMNKTQAWVQHSYVGDTFDEIRLGLFTDADFAGDKSDSKSTSGVVIAAIGPHTYAPIVSISKKQGCVSTSTCESEVVAMNLGLKEAMSILDLWQALEPLPSRSGGSSVGAAVADAGGPPIQKVPARLPGGIPAEKRNRRHPQRSQYHFWHTKIIKVPLLR